MAASKLRVTQVRSGIGRMAKQRRILQGLGLRGPHSEVVVDNTPSFRGMIKKVLHLVRVEDVGQVAESKGDPVAKKEAPAKEAAAASNTGEPSEIEGTPVAGEAPQDEEPQ